MESYNNFLVLWKYIIYFNVDYQVSLVDKFISW